MPASPPARPSRPGTADRLTSNAVTAIIGVIAAMAFLFSFGNVTLLCIHLGVPRMIAWMVSPAVDLSVTGLLLGQSALAQRRRSDHEAAPSLWKPRLMLFFCGAFTLALNTAGPLAQGRTGTACVDAVLPVLLMAWSEVGPWIIRELNAGIAQDILQPAREDEQTRETARDKAATPVPMLPARLVHKARALDAAHRQAHDGRPISRDSLKKELAISTDRASSLIRIIRAETSAPPGDDTTIKTERTPPSRSLPAAA
jgi:hypothetical protein